MRTTRGTGLAKKFTQSVAFPVWILALTVVLGLASHIIVGTDASILERNLLNSLHAPGFAVLTVIALLASRKLLAGRQPYIFTAAFCLVVGIAGETLQYFGPRDASLVDLLNDLLGTGGVLFLAATFDRQFINIRRGSLRYVLFVAGATFLIAGLLPTVWYSYALLQRNQALPEILGFEHWWENEIFRASGGAKIRLRSKPPEWPALGAHVAEIISGTSEYSGIEVEPPTTWSEYTALSFVVGTTSEKTEHWTLRINDLSHDKRFDDRFNLKIEIGPVPTRVRVPLAIIRSSPGNRDMDTDAISRLILFYQKSDNSSAILFDDLRLEMP